jgi:hypothetical protein
MLRLTSAYGATMGTDSEPGPPHAGGYTTWAATRQDLPSMLRVEADRLDRYREQFLVLSVSIDRDDHDQTTDDPHYMIFGFATVGDPPSSEEDLQRIGPLRLEASRGRCEVVEEIWECEVQHALRSVADLIEALPATAPVRDVVVSRWTGNHGTDRPEAWRIAVYLGDE